MQVPVELKIKYLSRRLQEIENLRLALDNDDFSVALKLGHQVKGNAETFEFPQMTGLGIDIEKAAKAEDKEGVLQFAERMEVAITNAQAMFLGQYPVPSASSGAAHPSNP